MKIQRYQIVIKGERGASKVIQVKRTKEKKGRRRRAKGQKWEEKKTGGIK